MVQLASFMFCVFYYTYAHEMPGTKFGPCEHLQWQCSDAIEVLTVCVVVTSINETFPPTPKFT